MVRARRDSAASTLLFTSALLFVEWLSILWATGGHFSYALDDAYIHLSLARTLAEGHYGLDSSHFSSPSSSMAWPFLLAIFAGMRGLEFVPLALNCTFALAFGVICQRTLEENLGSVLPRRGVGSAPFLAMVVIVVCNVVPTVFLGLEHSLQLLVSAFAVRGLGRYFNRGQPRFVDFIPFVVGPLIRYENLGLTLGLVSFLAMERQFRSSARVLAASLVAPLAFGLFLMAHGDPVVPTSIYAKSPLAWSHSGLGSLGLIASRAADALVHSNRGLLFGLCAALEIWFGATSPSSRGRRMVCIPLVPLVLHLFFGDYGRYELYLWAFVVLFAAVQLNVRGLGGRTWNRGRAWALALGLSIAGAPYLGRLVQTPFGARSIYYQQGTLAELSRQLGASVAANDIGLISFRSGFPVVDLWGLSSYEILKARKSRRETDWMEDVLARQGVRFALIYDAWFVGQVPKVWIKVAELTYPGPIPSAAERTVSCYARDDQAARALEAALEGLGSAAGKREVVFLPRVSSLP